MGSLSLSKTLVSIVKPTHQMFWLLTAKWMSSKVSSVSFLTRTREASRSLEVHKFQFGSMVQIQLTLQIWRLFSTERNCLPLTSPSSAELGLRPTIGMESTSLVTTEQPQYKSLQTLHSLPILRTWMNKTRATNSLSTRSTKPPKRAQSTCWHWQYLKRSLTISSPASTSFTQLLMLTPLYQSTLKIELGAQCSLRWVKQHKGRLMH